MLNNQAGIVVLSHYDDFERAIIETINAIKLMMIGGQVIHHCFRRSKVSEIITFLFRALTPMLLITHRL